MSFYKMLRTNRLKFVKTKYNKQAKKILQYYSNANVSKWTTKVIVLNTFNYTKLTSVYYLSLSQVFIVYQFHNCFFQLIETSWLKNKLPEAELTVSDDTYR